MANVWRVFDDNGRQRRMAIASDGSTVWVFLEGNTYTISSQSAGASRRRSGGGGDVMAPMPATVVTINTEVGKQVHEGDTIVVLEAMKMELPIKAPRAGVVKRINCSKGELVQPGVSLVDIE